MSLWYQQMKLKGFQFDARRVGDFYSTLKSKKEKA